MRRHHCWLGSVLIPESKSRQSRASSASQYITHDDGFKINGYPSLAETFGLFRILIIQYPSEKLTLVYMKELHFLNLYPLYSFFINDEKLQSVTENWIHNVWMEFYLSF